MERDLNDITQTSASQSTNPTDNTHRQARYTFRTRVSRDNNPQVIEGSQPPASTSQRRQEIGPSSTDKGKQKAIPDNSRSNKRSTKSALAVTASGIVINEPPKDLKGKKRAIPEPDSEDERQNPQQPPPKKLRSPATTAASSSTTAYTL
ncbi:hypothetical protein FRB99_003564, partial [Tulasnella sp. 403]